MLALCMWVMSIYNIIQNIIFLGLGGFVFFVLSFVFINTGNLVRDINKKFHYIIYLTMFLTLILSLFLFGLQWYVICISLLSGCLVYKHFS